MDENMRAREEEVEEGGEQVKKGERERGVLMGKEGKRKKKRGMGEREREGRAAIDHAYFAFVVSHLAVSQSSG